jgi:hypothetical protein
VCVWLSRSDAICGTDVDRNTFQLRHDPTLPLYNPEHPIDGGLPTGYEFQAQVDSIVKYNMYAPNERERECVCVYLCVPMR